jgi:hypothetical protein
MKKLQVVKYDGGDVVKEFDVTNKGEREIDRLDIGLNINLNHEEYYTRIVEE